MSAFALHKHPKGSALSNRCEDESCDSMGRFRVEFCGHPVRSRFSFGGSYRQAQLCLKHGKEALAVWREFSGEQVEDEARDAVSVLAAVAGDESGAATVQRVDAIDTLASLGFDEGSITCARAQALDGYSVDQILEGLAGVEQVGAVAA